MNNKKKKGFTLIELLATIAIIGTIMGIATVIYTTIIKKNEINFIRAPQKWCFSLFHFLVFYIIIFLGGAIYGTKHH